MKKLLYTIFVFSSCSLSALLPPAWQDIAELKAIVNAPQLNAYLDSGDAIEEIARTKGGWVIRTNHKDIYIDVITKPQEMPGPKQFDLKFH